MNRRQNLQRIFNEECEDDAVHLMDVRCFEKKDVINEVARQSKRFSRKIVGLANQLQSCFDVISDSDIGSSFLCII